MDLFGGLGKAFLDKGVDIDAEVKPRVSLNHVVGNPGMHLVAHNFTRPLTQHQPAPILQYKPKLKTEPTI